MVLGSAKSKVRERIGNWATITSGYVVFYAMRLSWKLIQSWNYIFMFKNIHNYAACIRSEEGKILVNIFTMSLKMKSLCLIGKYSERPEDNLSPIVLRYL